VPPDHRALLTAVADALNACDTAGLRVKLKHGVVWSAGGYVLPLGEDLKAARWAARTRIYTEFSPADDIDDD
jgi:hypothetical protein